MGYTFIKTADGSIGLYDNEVKDIYHSSDGAYSEAINKFIVPSQLERFKNSKCKVLDICYGIGYNTKALLKYSMVNNLNIQYEIDAFEINKELIELSPFIKNYDKSYINFEIDKFILSSILISKKFNFNKIKSIIKNNKSFLSDNKPDFNKKLKNCGYNYGVLDNFNAFLHNIYYHNITKRHFLGQKCCNIQKCSLKWHVGDARKLIFNIEPYYDLIFLDAFTASKQPILWTNQFIKQLACRLNQNTGLIISYSTASPYRSALINSGLNVGKFYTEKINGTLASYNDFLLKYKLNDFEIGLLQTHAGIPYNDVSLDLSSEQILELRNTEIKNSNLESTSSYYRRHNRKHGKQ